MRTFYAFKIKEEFISLYHDYPTSLFHILRQLYSMTPKDAKYGYTLFQQLTKPIDKYDVNKQLYVKYHREMTYSKVGNEHIINNLYKDEISVLVAKNSYIHITTNHNHSSFFSILSSLSSEYFVCDFQYQDYFWINDVKMLV